MSAVRPLAERHRDLGNAHSHSAMATVPNGSNAAGDASNTCLTPARISVRDRIAQFNKSQQTPMKTSHQQIASPSGKHQHHTSEHPGAENNADGATRAPGSLVRSRVSLLMSPSQTAGNANNGNHAGSIVQTPNAKPAVTRSLNSAFKASERGVHNPPNFSHSKPYPLSGNPSATSEYLTASSSAIAAAAQDLLQDKETAAACSVAAAVVQAAAVSSSSNGPTASKVEPGSMVNLGKRPTPLALKAGKNGATPRSLLRAASAMAQSSTAQHTESLPTRRAEVAPQGPRATGTTKARTLPRFPSTTATQPTNTVPTTKDEAFASPAKSTAQRRRELAQDLQQGLVPVVTTSTSQAAAAAAARFSNAFTQKKLKEEIREQKRVYHELATKRELQERMLEEVRKAQMERRRTLMALKSPSKPEAVVVPATNIVADDEHSSKVIQAMPAQASVPIKEMSVSESPAPAHIAQTPASNQRKVISKENVTPFKSNVRIIGAETPQIVPLTPLQSEAGESVLDVEEFLERAVNDPQIPDEDISIVYPSMTQQSTSGAAAAVVPPSPHHLLPIVEDDEDDSDDAVEIDEVKASHKRARSIHRLSLIRLACESLQREIARTELECRLAQQEVEDDNKAEVQPTAHNAPELSAEVPAKSPSHSPMSLQHSLETLRETGPEPTNLFDIVDPASPVLGPTHPRDSVAESVGDNVMFGFNQVSDPVVAHQAHPGRASTHYARASDVFEASVLTDPNATIELDLTSYLRKSVCEDPVKPVYEDCARPAAPRFEPVDSAIVATFSSTQTPGSTISFNGCPDPKPSSYSRWARAGLVAGFVLAVAGGAYVKHVGAERAQEQLSELVNYLSQIDKAQISALAESSKQFLAESALKLKAELMALANELSTHAYQLGSYGLELAGHASASMKLRLNDFTSSLYSLKAQLASVEYKELLLILASLAKEKLVAGAKYAQSQVSTYCAPYFK